jgi:hypothetical protein
MMKPHHSILFISLLALTACANNTVDIKPTDHAQHGNKHGQKTEKNPLCAETNTTPNRLCSDTVTANFDHKGIFWITWVNNGFIYVQSSSDKGINYSPPVKVNSTAEQVAAKGSSRPKIMFDKTGIIYLSWDLTLDKKHSTHIRFSRSTDGGQHFSAPVTLNDNHQVIRHRFDSMAIGQNGEIFMAWLDGRDEELAKKAGKDFKGLSVYYTWSDDGGQHFKPNKSVADHACECCRIDTAIAKDNTPVIAWRHIFEGKIRDHALVKFKDWNTPGEMVHLGDEKWAIDACPHHGPSLAISDIDTYHAVWFSGAETQKGLFYAYSTTSGERFSKPLNFGKEGASHPNVLGLGKQVAIVWQEFDGTHNTIQTMKSTDDGKTWSTPAALIQSTEAFDEPFLVSDGGHIYVSVQSQKLGYQLKQL